MAEVSCLLSCPVLPGTQWCVSKSVSKNHQVTPVWLSRHLYRGNGRPTHFFNCLCSSPQTPHSSYLCLPLQPHQLGLLPVPRPGPKQTPPGSEQRRCCGRTLAYVYTSHVTFPMNRGRELGGCVAITGSEDDSPVASRHVTSDPDWVGVSAVGSPFQAQMTTALSPLDTSLHTRCEP